jgi:hypothetical protein
MFRHWRIVLATITAVSLSAGMPVNVAAAQSEKATGNSFSNAGG